MKDENKINYQNKDYILSRDCYLDNKLEGQWKTTNEQICIYIISRLIDLDTFSSFPIQKFTNK